MKNELLILGYGLLCFGGGYWLHSTGGIDDAITPELSKSTIYTVKCVDDILTGEFVKVNDKYFRHDATEPTWIPLSQCGLEPKKQTRN